MRRALLVLAVLALAACQKPASSPPSADPPAPIPSAAAKAAPGIRYIIGGDSRQDTAQVIPWAFREAKARGVGAFLFLGDMELKPELDPHFRAELDALAPIPFYPVLGNHESARRKNGEEAPRDARVRAVHNFRGLFLGKPTTPVDSAFDDKLAYSLDLPGGVHFVALDNVSQPGFGADQLAWLTKDLEGARGKARHVIVGMHRALAGNGVTKHSMDEDGPSAVADSAAALALFQKEHVELLVASHFHGFAELQQGGLHAYITGGLGAPLDVAHGNAGSFHHYLLVGVPEGAPLTVEVVRFTGAPAIEREEEH